MFGSPRRVVAIIVCALAACAPEEGAPNAPSPPSSERPTAEAERGEGGASTPRCILADGAGTRAGDVVDTSGRATASVESGEACARVFVLSSSAPRRDDEPKSGRRVAERVDRPSLQTRNAMFDALYQLAIAELDEASVAAIRDGAFRNGEPLACPNGCFETGKKWPYVWTRDTAYAAHLGIASLDPTRARGSLELKISERRAGGDLQIVQDTGTGGSYPVSTDRIVWALGARSVIAQLTGGERDAFARTALSAITNTLAHDRAVVFDREDGLYRGEQSFLDWRSQSYASWTVPDTVHIATSKSLSTNVAHLAAIETAADLAAQQGDGAASARLRADATALRDRIRARFWLEEEGNFSSFLPTELDSAPTRRFDLLATSLAVLADVATPAQAKRAISRYPLFPAGPPVLFPEQQDAPIYHNRAIWPFVTAYFTAAAKKAENGRAAAAGITSLVRGAALNLSNIENLELVTGKPWVEEGPTSGPVVNSQRQLWSIGGYLHVVNEVLFGVTPTLDGVDIAPFVPRALRSELFGDAESVVLNNLPASGKPLSIVLRLPPASASRDGAYRVARITLNGKNVEGGHLRSADLEVRNLVVVELADDGAGPPDETTTIVDASDYRTVFGPRTPSVTNVTKEAASLAVEIARGNEQPDDVSFDVYRDGVRIATGLPGTTTRFVDEGATTASHCYTVESRFVTSGNASQRARPVCFWGASGERIQTIDAPAFSATGGTLANGRRSSWGDPGHTIVATFTAQYTGPHLVQALYANGHGGIDTGITCAVKRIDVREAPADTGVASGYLVMPQRGEWSSVGESSSLRVSLAAGKTYRVRLAHDERSTNMSAFQHFADYTGGAGGKSGATYRVDIAAVKVLSLQ